MEELAKKYGDRDVEVFVMYVREPHAKERGFRQYRKHESYDHKMECARLLVKKHSLVIPYLVDGFSEKLHQVLGNLPNLVYVVDKKGEVFYKSTWTDADAIDEILAELVSAEDPSRPVQKTMDSRRVPGRIPVEV
jgi:hypothetical protein